MATYDTVYVIQLVVLFHLVVFALALVVLAISMLVRATFPRLYHIFSGYLFTLNTARRMAEIRSIGAQAREEMRQLNHDYLYWLIHGKGVK